MQRQAGPQKAGYKPLCREATSYMNLLFRSIMNASAFPKGAAGRKRGNRLGAMLYVGLLS
jgi:hypothetical protein